MTTTDYTDIHRPGKQSCLCKDCQCDPCECNNEDDNDEEEAVVPI